MDKGMKLKDLKEVYVKQMERIEGAKARKFDKQTYESWWLDGVKAYGFKAIDIEYAAGEICISSDAFPILSTFIFHCGAMRRKRRAEDRKKEQRQEEGARDLSAGGILEHGAKSAQGKKARAAIKNTQDFLEKKIDRATWAKRQDEIEKADAATS